jgi:hypothetical protein
VVEKRRVNIRGILANPDLRRELMVPTLQATQAREGIETTREQAERAYYVVTEAERAAFFDLQRFRGGKGESDRRHEVFVRALRGEAPEVRFDVARRDFGTIEGSPLAYGRLGVVAHIFRDAPALEPGWGIAAQGLATADDERFVRDWWEVPSHRVGQGKEWVPFAKGGEYSRFYADVYLVVQWTTASIKTMEGIGRVQNVGHYFKPGLTWPLRTQRGFNLRMMPSGCIFGHKGPAVFPSRDGDIHFLLGVANSAAGEYLLGGLMSFGSWEVGVIKRLPVPQPTSKQNEHIGSLAKAIHDAKATWDEGNETSTRFRVPWLLRDDLGPEEATIASRLDHLAEHEVGEEAHIQRLYAELNADVYKLYGISSSTRITIEDTLAERPAEVLWPQMEGKSVEQKRMEHVWRLLSYVVKRVLEADKDGIVSFGAIAGDPRLVDRVRNELAELLPRRDVNQVEVQVTNELNRTVKSYRRCVSIDEWLNNVLFEYHCALYKSRPIVWHIASAQGTSPFAFGVAVHYHRFDKNGMATLRGSYLRDAIEESRREAALADKAGRAAERLEWQAKVEEAQALDQRLQRIQEGHHEGPDGGDSDYRILTPWKKPNERPKGWAPDFDDGVAVNVGPFQKAGVLRVARVT